MGRGNADHSDERVAQKFKPQDSSALSVLSSTQQLRVENPPFRSSRARRDFPLDPMHGAVG
jgi:hypothetical protein